MTWKPSLPKAAALGALAALIAIAVPCGAVSAAASALRAHVSAQQALAAAARGPLTQAWQDAGLELTLEAPHSPVQRDRRVTVALRGDDFAHYDQARFGPVSEALLTLNNGDPQAMVFVDAPAPEPDYFEALILATDMNLFGNSGSVLVRDAFGREMSFNFTHVF